MAPGTAILVVDDDPPIRTLLERYLERHGYRISGAASAENALELVENEPGGFDAYVIDVTLPGMSGEALAREILTRSPTAKVLLSSGYPLNPALLRFHGAERVAFLQKPFAPSALLEALSTL